MSDMLVSVALEEGTGVTRLVDLVSVGVCIRESGFVKSVSG